MAKRKPAHHRGDYARRAKAVRDAANADPTTRCWRCGRTQAEHGQPWQAGHLNDARLGRRRVCASMRRQPTCVEVDTWQVPTTAVPDTHARHATSG